MKFNVGQQGLCLAVNRACDHLVPAGVISRLISGVDHVQVGPEAVLLTYEVQFLHDSETCPVGTCTAFQAGTKCRRGICHNGGFLDLQVQA